MNQRTNAGDFRPVGRWNVNCPRLNEEWGEKLRYICVNSDNRRLWADLDLYDCCLSVRFDAEIIPPTPSPDTKLTFRWREELPGYHKEFGDGENEGSITFKSDTLVEGFISSKNIHDVWFSGYKVLNGPVSELVDVGRMIDGGEYLETSDTSSHENRESKGRT